VRGASALGQSRGNRCRNGPWRAQSVHLPSDDALRELTGFGLARAENLVDATQNADVFVEVSGIMKALARRFSKYRRSSFSCLPGPDAGFGEVRLPSRQAGQSINAWKGQSSDSRSRQPGRDAGDGDRFSDYDGMCASEIARTQPFLPMVAAVYWEPRFAHGSYVSCFPSYVFEISLPIGTCAPRQSVVCDGDRPAAMVAASGYGAVEQLIRETRRRATTTFATQRAASGLLAPEEFDGL